MSDPQTASVPDWPLAGVGTLSAGLDFRKKEYRREVFLRFYEFHLRWRSHPGCVYYLLPWMREHWTVNEEQALWFAFLNGNTQNPVTSWILWRVAPTPVDADKLVEFFGREYSRLAFDTDRRHHKPHLPDAIAAYLCALDGRPQGEVIREAVAGGWPSAWSWATSLHTFGRLSAFSYLEYLRITGIDVECEDLMLGDLHGSRSHRNGLLWVLGHEEFDWHESNPGFDGQYSAKMIDWLTYEASRLLEQMRGRADWLEPAVRQDIGYFTLESTLCTYKSWHRPNRRYPNVYNDLLYERIRTAEAAWPELDFLTFWNARRASLPPGLRLEDCPYDPGCVPAKQNHYRLSGEVVMMDLEWECFTNSFAEGVRRGAYGVRRR